MNLKFEPIKNQRIDHLFQNIHHRNEISFSERLDQYGQSLYPNFNDFPFQSFKIRKNEKIEVEEQSEENKEEDEETKTKPYFLPKTTQLSTHQHFIKKRKIKSIIKNAKTSDSQKNIQSLAKNTLDVEFSQLPTPKNLTLDANKTQQIISEESPPNISQFEIESSSNSNNHVSKQNPINNVPIFQINGNNNIKFTQQPIFQINGNNNIKFPQQPIQITPMETELQILPIIPQKNDQPQVQQIVLGNHEEILLENNKKIEEISKYYDIIKSQIPPDAKDEIEGKIRRGIGQMYGSSMLRLFETAEEFIITYERYKNSENITIFFAKTLVKITLEHQVDIYFSQSEDKDTMRDRLARIAILFHFINLQCSCLLQYAVGILTQDIPLLIPKNLPGKQEKNMSIYYKKIEYYAYLYFSIISFDMNNYFSTQQLQEMEKKLIEKNQKSDEFQSILDNFRKTQIKLKNFLRNKNSINFHEFYWKFVETFFKLPICELSVLISISFCYASYFIWKKEGDKILKLITKLNDIYLPKLKVFHTQMQKKNEKESFRINYNRLEEIVENVISAKAFPTFEEKKDDDD